MQAIEFEAKVHNGTIKLPENYALWSERKVRVILLAGDASGGAATAIKRRKPHPAIAGEGKTTGDLLTPVVDEEGDIIKKRACWSNLAEEK